MATPVGGTFRSLSNRNFRLWIGSSLISNIGTWMQGTAQNWLVLTELTDHSASAVGLVVALQFLPQLLLVAVTGSLADHVDRRKLLIVVQCVLALIALLLGAAILSGHVRLWQVDLFAFLLGCGMAFDSPARHSFISELVGEEGIGNAVAINGTAFQIARTAGPAMAGVCIALVGTGWVFVLNGLSYAFVIAGLVAMKVTDLHRHDETEGGEGGEPEGAPTDGGGRGRREMRLLDGFRYVRGRPDLITVLLMLFFMGAIGMNFGIFIGVMSVAVFHRGASEYGALSSVMAIGSVIGALLAARRDRPRMPHLIGGAFLFGCAMALAAAAPSFWSFGAVLLIVGLSAQTMNTSANGFVQLSTARAMRGRVMAIYVAIMLGGLPLGAPLVGWVADRFGPRAAIGLGAGAGFVAALVGTAYLVRVRGLRLERIDGRVRLHIRPDPHQPA